VFEGRNRCFLALAPAAVFSALIVCGAIGHAHAQDNLRVFGVFDPVVDFIRADGGRFVGWLFEHAVAVGGVLFVAVALVALAGLVSARKRSSSLILACVGVGAVGWGQICIVEERFLLGTCLYVAGVACAFVLGRVCPMRRLPGFPPCFGFNRGLLSPGAGGRDSASEGPAESTLVQRVSPPEGSVQGSKTYQLQLECAFVAVLTILGLLLRMYGLTELPHGFDNEVIKGMIEARTGHGVSNFLTNTFLGPSVGFAHVPIQYVSYQILGTSVFSVRMASVFWGTLTIPLFYWLLRRMSGIAPAFLGTLLFIAAPEQLFWSRSENGQFAPMTFFAVVSGHLALWLGCRATWRSALAAALWMPVGTFFYFPCVVLTVLPALTWAYAVAFARRGWRTARHVLPLLALGAIGFFVCKSLVIYGVGDEELEFHSPLVVHGDVAWKGHIQDSEPSMVEVVRHQAGRVMSNLPHVARGLTYGDLNSSHWFQRRTHGPQPGPALNIAITALLALGIGFLLGQPRDLRAAVLLFWVVLALAPGVLSDQPSPRRIGMVYPAAIAIAAIQLAVLWRVARVVSGPRLGRIVGALCVVLTMVIVSTNLVSHFRLPIRPVLYSVISEFIRPELEASDTIYHTFERSFGEAVFLNHLDRFVDSNRPCIESLDDGNWPSAALFPECHFDEIYGHVLSPDTIEGIRDSYEQRNVSFVIHDRFGGDSYLEALKVLYPEAASHLRHLSRQDFGDVYALRVPAATLSEKRHPLIVDEDTTGPRELSVHPSARVQLSGGFLISTDGWYRFRVLWPEGDFVLRIDGRSAVGIPAQPMLAGMHDLEVELPANGVGEPPFEIEMIGDRAGTSRILQSADLSHPSVASIPGIQAPPVAEVDGFDAWRHVAKVAGHPKDLGVDGAGRLFVLSWDRGDYVVSRLSSGGLTEKEWRPPVGDYDRACLAVDKNGRVVVVGRRQMLFYSPDGELEHTSPLNFHEPALDAAFMTDGRMLLATHERNSLELFDGTGRHLDTLGDHGADNPEISRPVGLAIGPEGGLLVVEENGRALLFRVADTAWPPLLERVFDTGMGSPVDSRGCAFEGPRRFVIPNRNTCTARVYDRTGRRAMARTSTRDLSAYSMPHPVAFTRYGNTLYAVDETLGSLMALDIAEPGSDPSGPGSP